MPVYVFVIQGDTFPMSRLMVFYSPRLRTLRRRRVQLMISDCHPFQMILAVKHAHLNWFAYAS
jgi:hypothetical protein